MMNRLRSPFPIPLHGIGGVGGEVGSEVEPGKKVRGGGKVPLVLFLFLIILF